MINSRCFLCAQVPSRLGSAGSNLSLNIDAALCCFDFLDNESDEEASTSEVTSPEKQQKTQLTTEHRHECKEDAKDVNAKPIVTLDDLIGKPVSPTHSGSAAIISATKDNTNSLESKCSFKFHPNSLGSSGKSSLSNTLEDKSVRSSEGSKSSDSSTLEDGSRSSGGGFVLALF